MTVWRLRKMVSLRLPEDSLFKQVVKRQTEEPRGKSGVLINPILILHLKGGRKLALWGSWGRLGFKWAKWVSQCVSTWEDFRLGQTLIFAGYSIHPFQTQGNACGTSGLRDFFYCTSTVHDRRLSVVGARWSEASQLVLSSIEIAISPHPRSI